MDDVSAFLHEVASSLEAAGAWPGQDFVVRSVTTAPAFGDEFELRATDDGFEVCYDERGQRSVLLSTSDPAEARAFFVERVLELARERGSAGPA